MTRPLLTIERASGGGALGNCYSSHCLLITSTAPLDGKQILALRAAGVLGYGQECYFWLVGADGKKTMPPEEIGWQDRPKVVATGHDLEERTNKIGERLPDLKIPYYQYLVENRVDSSD